MALASELDSVVELVWEQYLDIGLNRVPLEEEQFSRAATIQISGPFSGYIRLHFTEDLAETATNRFLKNSYTGSEEELIDVIREITNMIGGHLKTSLSQLAGGEACELSIPKVSQEDEAVLNDEFTFEDDTLKYEFLFSSDEGKLLVGIDIGNLIEGA